MRIEIVVTHSLSPDVLSMIGVVVAVATLLVLLCLAVRRNRP